jgi:predicted HTH transcriptional regulator
MSISNLIYGVPVYRNLLTADGARFVGLCDKIGQGIDLIFKGVLRGGFGFPEFESSNNLFTARVPLTGSEEFREFLRRRSQSLCVLDEIVILRLLWVGECASIEKLSLAMQRKPEFAERIAREMCTKGMIEQLGGEFRLASVLRRDIETIFASDQMSLWGDVTPNPERY